MQDGSNAKCSIISWSIRNVGTDILDKTVSFMARFIYALGSLLVYEPLKTISVSPD